MNKQYQINVTSKLREAALNALGSSQYFRKQGMDIYAKFDTFRIEWSPQEHTSDLKACIVFGKSGIDIGRTDTFMIQPNTTGSIAIHGLDGDLSFDDPVITFNGD